MMHLICRIACVVAAVAAICIGLSAFDINVMGYMPDMMKTPNAMKVLKIVVGAAGVLGLVKVFMHHHDCHCGDKK